MLCRRGRVLEFMLSHIQNLRGHLASAMSHIQGGVRILEGIGESLDDNLERLENKHEFNLAPRSKFEVLFNRLDSQVNQVCRRNLAKSVWAGKSNL